MYRARGATVTVGGLVDTALHDTLRGECERMLRSRRNLALALSLPMMVMGCEHALWGNAMALGLSVMLFVGTLQLGRRAQVPAEGGPAQTGDAR